MDPTWLAARVREVTDLLGTQVVAWQATEMAFSGGEDGEPAVFRDPALPFRQLLFLTAMTSDGTARTVDTYQDGTGFGLLTGRGRRPMAEEAGILRPVPDLPLPRGTITEVHVFTDHGVLAEIRLRLGGHPLLLIAGEVHPTFAGGYALHRLDESVLVFPDPDAAADLPWVPARRPSAPVVSSRLA